MERSKGFIHGSSGGRLKRTYILILKIAQKAIQIKKFWPKVDKLKALYLKEQDGRRKERLLAVILMYEVNRIPEVVAIIKCHRDTVWKWINRFK